jgi:uncharacterized protein YjbI with pentapeptide repeats
MANPEHLARLKEGVERWNLWRRDHPDAIPGLGSADLSGAYLRGVNFVAAALNEADFRKAYLNGADLRGAYLNGADLRGANLTVADLRGADLRGANASEAALDEADLRWANLSGADVCRANLMRADLRGARLIESRLRETRLVGANLSGADLSDADLDEAHLHSTQFSGACLVGADLSGARLIGANLNGADMCRANLIRADLSGADLRGTDLRSANLIRADLSGVDLRDTDFGDAKLGRTVFSNTNLGSAKGLDTCRHFGPSIIEHRTLAKSGPLPLSFLRGCGLPDQLIQYLPSLLNQAIQFYSCFISYSTMDQEFAARLHADLQDKGVRCWFAPHNIQGGKKIYEQIEEAIRLYDRLLLILSDASMNSEWVKTEIAHARQKEKNQKRRVLFPITLVPFSKIREWKCFDGDTGKDSAREIREYFVPDFSHWKNHDSYKVAFDRLVKDFRSE